jgi:hypothetical protein
MVREILDLKAENPMNLQIEKPPKFIGATSLSIRIVDSLNGLVAPRSSIV